MAGLLVVAVAWIGYRELGPSSQTVRQMLPNSVAVLPCDNLSPNPDNAYFAASLHEKILNQLVKLKELNVIARISVLQYAAAARPIPEIADELNVESVMECSVSYANERVAITAQLIEGATGIHRWSERYNRELSDVFGIQADIAMNVANALRIEFSLAEQEAINQLRTSSAAAYALYLKAKSLFDGTPGRLTEIHEVLDRAIEIDPGFASAYGLKALAQANLQVNTVLAAAVPAEDRDALESEIRELASHATELNSANADARAALRAINIPTWRWSEAVEAVEPRDYPSLATDQLWVYS